MSKIDGYQVVNESISINEDFDVSTIGSVSVAGGIPWVLYRSLRSYFDRCNARCGTFKINTKTRRLCRLKCKKEYLEKAINAAKKHNDLKRLERYRLQLQEVNTKIQALMSRASGMQIAKSDPQVTFSK